MDHNIAIGTKSSADIIGVEARGLGEMMDTFQTAFYFSLSLHQSLGWLLKPMELDDVPPLALDA
jgi:hypothetical protein